MFCSFHSTIKLTPIPISTDATYMQPGDFLEDDIEVEKVIGQNKLRVIWPRRDGDEPDPPGADIPKGWGHIIDTINTDIVIPAEHTINGRQFVGEYRIFHMHDGGKGAAVITSLMEIHPLNKRNSMINQFQLKFEEDMLKCQKKKARTSSPCKQQGSACVARTTVCLVRRSSLATIGAELSTKGIWKGGSISMMIHLILILPMGDGMHMILN